MASSNPFRKSAAFTVDTATFPNSTSSAAARFPSLDAFETASTPPPPTSFQQADASAIDHNSKVTKKVRVLSPPPLSPDPPEWAYTSPTLAQYAVNQQSENDPFDATSTDDSDLETVAAAARRQALTGGQGAGNPFSKATRDLDSPIAEQKLEQERKEEGYALKVANKAKHSLDVNSFKRLLMTGNSESDKALGLAENDTRDQLSAPRRSSHEAREASLISRDPSDIPEDEIGQESVSDSSASARVDSKSSKKPPPPPSSRHGKSIKLNLVGNQTPPEALATLSPSEINKPLPPAPIRKSLDEEGESPFDREAAGKVSGTDADTGVTSPGRSGGERKAVPAPPPRRGHARAESKANTAQHHIQKDENLSRTSSMRSRPGHKRQNSQAGAPPPPPRRSHVSKHSTQLPTGTNSSFADLSQSSSSPAPSLDVDLSTTSTPSQLRQGSTLDLTSPRDGQHPTPKSSAPPPPPARNTSVRRPASIRSVESSSRRVSFEAKPYNQMAPPPPPRRQRGSSKGSIDGPRRTSLDSVGRAESIQVPEEEHDAVPEMIGSGHTSPKATNEPGKSFDILADLDALQREVDALRGKLG
ncbi:hypothetical protein ACHAPO_005747 [Fusarium lateritium]